MSTLPLTGPAFAVLKAGAQLVNPPAFAVLSTAAAGALKHAGLSPSMPSTAAAGSPFPVPVGSSASSCPSCDKAKSIFGLAASGLPFIGPPIAAALAAASPPKPAGIVDVNIGVGGIVLVGVAAWLLLRRG